MFKSKRPTGRALHQLIQRDEEERKDFEIL
jgi:hypothetical protein